MRLLNSAVACKINLICLNQKQISLAELLPQHCGAAFHWCLLERLTTQIINVFIDVQQWDTVVGYIQKWLLECQTLFNESHAPAQQ